MGDISISRVYQFLSNYNKSGDWKTEADKNGNGIISKLEAYTFLDNNFFKPEGLNDNDKERLFYDVWKTLDIDIEGKVRDGSKVNDKGALNEQEIAQVQKNIQIAERIDNFVNNNIRGKEPSVISNKTGWLNSVKDGITEKAFDYIAKNKNADITDAKLREFYELTYRKATADYYFAELKNEIGKDLSEYKVGDDSALNTIVESYIQSLTGDTSTSLETIIAKVKELVEAYKDTAVTNSKTGTLEPYGYNASGELNDLQNATLTKTITDVITNHIKNNYSDLYTGEKYIASADAVISQYVAQYLSGKSAADFVSLKNFDISKIDVNQLVSDIKDAQAGTRSAEAEAARNIKNAHFAALAGCMNDIIVEELGGLRNGKSDINTEFGMDSNGNIVFEDPQTTAIFTKLKKTVKDRLRSAQSESLSAIGESNIDKIVQAAWIMTYNTYPSSQNNSSTEFLRAVLKNIEAILNKLSTNSEYLEVYTSRTAYANKNLTTGLKHYGTNTTYGNDQDINYGGNIIKDTDGTVHISNLDDDPDYQGTMITLLKKIKDTEPYKNIDESIITSVFQDAQFKAIKACQDNANDCPYGTGNNGGYVEDARKDWGGRNNRKKDDSIIYMKELVQITLYYFDKLLYEKLAE